MERYDYQSEIKEDVKSEIEFNYADELKAFKDTKLCRSDLFEKLNDELFCSDSVTGNASGSYYCNAWSAEESLCHNLDLLCEALDAFGDDYKIISSGAEACDVAIRCYLLPTIIDEVLDEYEQEFEEEEDKNEK